MKHRYGDIIEIFASPEDYPSIAHYNGMRGRIKYIDRKCGIYIVHILPEYRNKVDIECGQKIKSVCIPDWCAKRVLAPARKVPTMRVE